MEVRFSKLYFWNQVFENQLVDSGEELFPIEDLDELNEVFFVRKRRFLGFVYDE